MDWINTSDDNQIFIFSESGKRFAPIGFNYDHDEHYRLIEDYWHDEWKKVVADFTAMKMHGARLVRVHLQLAKFINSPNNINEKEFSRLDDLFDLATELGLYLSLVGLGCYHKDDVPAWYSTLSTDDRWSIQAFFWQSIAIRYADNPACFCFDLMNEPVVPGRVRKSQAWLGGEFAGKSFLQFICLDGTQEPRINTAIRWIQRLSEAIRQHDKKRLITVGLVDWSLDKGGMTSAFFPEKIAPHLSFISAHLYPETGKVDAMLEILKHFSVGKPVVLDETFHLKCPPEEETWFLQQARQHAEGFVGFYTDAVTPPKTFHDKERNRAIEQWLAIHNKVAPLYY